MLVQEVEPWLVEFQSNESMHPFKSLAEAGYHDHSLAAVSLQHRLWVNRVEALVWHEMSLEDFTELDERSCFFSGWLEWAINGLDDEQQPLLKQVKSLHHQVHEIAKQVIQAVKNGDKMLAQERMRHLYEMQGRFINRLHGLTMPN